MAFWKKPLELPPGIYEAAGEFVLSYLQAKTMAQRLGFRDTWSGRIFKKSSCMTFNQAYELLDLAEDGFVKLRALLAQYPIKSSSQFELRERMCEKSTQSCEEQKKAILGVSPHDRSLPICEYSGCIDGQDAAHFEHVVICKAEWLDVEYSMAFKLMAKCANISSDKFNNYVVQGVKNTPRGKIVLAQAFAGAAP